MRTPSTGAMATWIVLFAWIFCGSVTFAEQLQVQVQTSEEESQACEEALQGVGQALKSATDVETCVASSHFSIVTWDLLFASNTPSNGFPIFYSLWPPPMTRRATSTASLLCIYRI